MLFLLLFTLFLFLFPHFSKQQQQQESLECWDEVNLHKCLDDFTSLEKWQNDFYFRYYTFEETVQHCRSFGGICYIRECGDNNCKEYKKCEDRFDGICREYLEQFRHKFYDEITLEFL